MNISTTIDDDLIGVLWGELSKEEPRSAFDFDRGHLGCAYLSASLLQIDDSRPWRKVYEHHLAAIFASLSRERYPHPGMLGGLSCLTFLLRSTAKGPGDFAKAVTKLENRLAMHMDSSIRIISESVGADRYKYDYAIGLAGTYYYFACFPPQDESLRVIVKKTRAFLSASCSSPRIEGLWTAAADIPDDVIERDPQASFGLLDLGMAHGITGVLAAFLADGMSAQSEVVENLIACLTTAIDRSLTATLPYYLTLAPGSVPNFFGPENDTVLGPPSRNGWCYGTPILEALAASYGLHSPDSWDLSFENFTSIDPQLGQFDEPGLCHGVGGRIAMRYHIGAPIPDVWEQRAQEFLQNLETNWGFWDECGGLAVVCLAQKRGLQLPAPLRMLGTGGKDANEFAWN